MPTATKPIPTTGDEGKTRIVNRNTVDHLRRWGMFNVEIPAATLPAVRRGIYLALGATAARAANDIATIAQAASNRFFECDPQYCAALGDLDEIRQVIEEVGSDHTRAPGLTYEEAHIATKVPGYGRDKPVELSGDRLPVVYQAARLDGSDAGLEFADTIDGFIEQADEARREWEARPTRAELLSRPDPVIEAYKAAYAAPPLLER
jgi:hypothetical protein